MHCSRFFAALTAAMLLVVCAGCGGEDKKDSSSTGSGATTQAKPSEKTGEMVGEKAAAISNGSPASSAIKGINA